MKKKLLFTASLIAYANTLWANPDLPGVDDFVAEMVEKHQFDAQDLQAKFKRVEVQDSILKLIARPAEKSKPWYEYREIFITCKRIAGGINFWQQHHVALTRAEQKFGVPAEVIISILGVETYYGRIVGNYRVADALSTLAFRYPPRSTFFRKELEQFLVLSREEQTSFLKPVGSYAGAMGLGQFMPSSYRAYAVDFDSDGHRDIWTNPVDAIGSIANYLHRHGWVAGEGIAYKTTVSNDVANELVKKGSKPSLSPVELEQADVKTACLPANTGKVALISLSQRDGEEYWVTTQNFYSITRYNHSQMYAMAVTQLAEAIRDGYNQ